MRKTLSTLAALVISASAAAAHADSINGYFSASAGATGGDAFTSSTINFSNPNVVGQGLGGTFATYLAPGNSVNFLTGTLPYHQGTNTPPLAVYPTGFVPIFTVIGTSGTTFTFEMSQYDATYFNPTNGATPPQGCTAGDTCLEVTGMGFFTSNNPALSNSGTATFQFSSQYVPNQPLNSITTFAASTQATAAVPTGVTPEPSSLALLGTGLLGVVGVCRRKFAL